MESPISDIFDPFVLNNIMEVTFIFSSRVFDYLIAKDGLTDLISMI